MSRSFAFVTVVVASIALEAHARGAGIENLALSRPVSVISGSPAGAGLPTLTDGSFLAAGTQWQSGTVWWTGLGAMFQVNLAETSEVMGAIGVVAPGIHTAPVFRWVVSPWIAVGAHVQFPVGAILPLGPVQQF